MISANIRPRDTYAARAGKCGAVVAASGGDKCCNCTCRRLLTNAEVKFDLSTSRKSQKTPYVADLKPGGRYVAKDM